MTAPSLTRMIVLGALVLSACTKKADECSSNSNCTNPMYPFCDVNGQFAASGGDKDVCTIAPPDCPVDLCGCTAGATTCGSDQQSVCNADGMSVTTSTCSLGCKSDGTACNTFVPSNGLGPALAAAAAQPDAIIPSGATIDTDTGTIVVLGGTQLNISSTIVARPSGSIRVFSAQSFVVGGATVSGTFPLALVAVGDVTINGHLDASANGSVAGAGAQSGVAPCAGTSDPDTGPGAGGGGNATPGGSGGAYIAVGEPGGVAITGFDVLIGGCPGGGTAQTPDPLVGGAGGGAIQIVSATSVTLSGVVDVGGGGGQASTGGGSGGLVIIESPVVAIGLAGGIAANGGGGGGCQNGADATPDSTAAKGGAHCIGNDALNGGGLGGTGAAPPGGGELDTTSSSDTLLGGGGGAAGRARVATADGTFMSASSSILSAAITNDTLVVQ